MKKLLLLFILALSGSSVLAQGPTQTPQYNANTRFEQAGTLFPTPNSYRTASGSPGKEYWQQKADYDIKVELDDENQRIIGTEVITYTNKSPDELRYLWLQLDQNLFTKNAMGGQSRIGGMSNQMPLNSLNNLSTARGNLDPKKEYGYKIAAVKDKTGNPLRYTINETMMRIELPIPMKPGGIYSFSIDWNYYITEYYGRSGSDFFSKDGNYNYFIAHWFPRMCVYDDVNGWQNKQFLGQGEFTLPFGDYKVEITAPNDHVVGATGECQNYAQVLSATQLKRMEQAKTATEPVVIVTQDEAVAAEKRSAAQSSSIGKKTWIFKAQNVRDFAFTSSRKFIWDAMQTDVYGNGRKIWSMSFYSKEGNPLWGKYSTRVVEHTLRSYGKRTIEYPYPVAISCHATSGGMEYPMISFNGGRPEADGTYSEATKYGMIGVIIHEVGHNFFPMIVNSDERQWTWMDEGLNTFCQYLAEQEWDRNYPSRRGEPQNITDYMKSDKTILTPIMASSDNVINLGSNAYAKPATGLNILRETIMGRELFDYAFKEYARRWAFKHPMPADFFRTMEDASGVDLDWFWKGWFYGVEPVDQDLAEVEWYAIDTQDPTKQKAAQKADATAKKQTISNMRNKTDIKETVVEKDPNMKDFYNSYDRYAVTDQDKKKYETFLASLSEDERKLVESGKNFYVLNLKNKGGLPMPVIVKAEYEDGTSEVFRYPAEIWRMNDKGIKKVIPTDKKVASWTLDPYMEIADIDTENNAFPRKPAEPTRFQVFKSQGGRFGGAAGPNPMQLEKQRQGGAVQGAPKN